MQKLKNNSANEEEKKQPVEMVTEGNDEDINDSLQDLLDNKSQTLEKMRNLKSIEIILSQLKEQR